jgi:hypothetical protein
MIERNYFVGLGGLTHIASSSHKAATSAEMVTSFAAGSGGSFASSNTAVTSGSATYIGSAGSGNVTTSARTSDVLDAPVALTPKRSGGISADSLLCRYGYGIYLI